MKKKNTALTSYQVFSVFFSVFLGGGVVSTSRGPTHFGPMKDTDWDFFWLQKHTGIFLGIVHCIFHQLKSTIIY